mgnify:CR=1 FL=1
MMNCNSHQHFYDESDDDTRKAMESGLNYLTRIGDKYSAKEFDSLLDFEHVDDALFMLYQATLSKCEDDDSKFAKEITPHIPTSHMRTMIRIAYMVGWYTHEQTSKEEWTIPQV